MLTCTSHNTHMRKLRTCTHHTGTRTRTRTPWSWLVETRIGYAVAPAILEYFLEGSLATSACPTFSAPNRTLVTTVSRCCLTLLPDAAVSHCSHTLRSLSPLLSHATRQSSSGMRGRGTLCSLCEQTHHTDLASNLRATALCRSGRTSFCWKTTRSWFLSRGTMRSTLD